MPKPPRRPFVPALLALACWGAFGQGTAWGEEATGRAASIADDVVAHLPSTAAAEAWIHHAAGTISYYAREFAGRLTASGERFDPEAMTMAHPSLPFGTKVRVTSMRSRRSVVVTVNDRGPHTGGRIGDLTPAAARELGMLRAGLVRARLEVLDVSSAAGSRPAPNRPSR